MIQKTALISVYNKAGIEDFAKNLIDLGWKIVASGGTKEALTGAGLEVQDAALLAGGGAIFGHRVVTLSREIHAGLLARDNAEDRAELAKLKIPFIDLVCADFYPLEEEVGNPKATRESVIEKTDIGGPTMVRSGAKGRRIVICDSKDRARVLEWLRAGEPDREDFLNNLAAKAEAMISRYCGLSADYHSKGVYENIFGEKILECAYGENGYQTPSFLYGIEGRAEDPLALGNWQLVAGSPMSYNNVCDLDRMLQTVTHIGAGFYKNFKRVPFIAVGAKHGNACGAGFASQEHAQRSLRCDQMNLALPRQSANDVEHAPVRQSIERMLLGDLRAIFGGSVMLNFPVDEKVADELIHRFSPEGVRRLLDIVAAPSFSPEAIEILSRKKGKCRLLANPALAGDGAASLDLEPRFRYVRGGFLKQPNYTFVPKIENSEAILAWAVGSTSNSNTITIVKDGRLYGNGVGQQDRVGAAKLAISRADEAAAFAAGKSKKADLSNAVAYSDSFFPFVDAVEVLADRGVKTIFSTSGSVNDQKIMEFCKSKGVDLLTLPDKEARGFYQH